MATRASPLVIESPYPERSVDDLVASLSNASAPVVALLNSVLAVAAEFESILQSAAQKANLEIGGPLSQTDWIVGTGHQPVVYHPGLLAKEEQAGVISAKLNATSVNFILDLDEHDCTDFSVPSIVSGLPTETRNRLGAGSGLAVSQRVENVPADGSSVFAAYKRLLGEPIAVANTVVKRAFGKIAVRQVPFSLLVRKPEVQRVLMQLSQSPSLFTTYNKALLQHRLENRIQNAANPFPNLADGELPLWIWNSTSNSRRVLRHGEEIAANEFLVPRGAFVSLFLRKYCCGLFIHGTGGRTYEPAVERIAKELNLEISSPYIIVSANQYPFSKFIDRFEELQSALTLVRSGPSHVGELLKALSWSEDERSTLIQLSTKKAELIAELHNAKLASQSTPRTTREIGIEIKKIDNELRTTIDSSSTVSKIREEFEILSACEPIIYRRDFPFWCATLEQSDRVK